jgi:hypothetical protein
MRPRLAARHRAARLGLAALLGILFGATLFGEVFISPLPPGSPAWLGVAPLFVVVFLPPALSLFLDAPVRRSWRVLLVALVTLALLVVGIPLVSNIFMASINPISGVNYALGTALIYAYIASIPLTITAAAAFTVGGVGGYADRWALTAPIAGALAWAAIGVVVLPAAYAWYYRINPCQNTPFCFSDAIFSLLVIIVVGGLVVAPLGGLLGGALRARVGRSAPAVSGGEATSAPLPTRR